VELCARELSNLAYIGKVEYFSIKKMAHFLSILAKLTFMSLTVRIDLDVKYTQHEIGLSANI
jgi:hypothetical protein